MQYDAMRHIARSIHHAMLMNRDADAIAVVVILSYLCFYVYMLLQYYLTSISACIFRYDLVPTMICLFGTDTFPEADNHQKIDRIGDG
jgi:hypothetical protein